jgi:hypothetical protein
MQRTLTLGVSWPGLAMMTAFGLVIAGGTSLASQDDTKPIDLLDPAPLACDDSAWTCFLEDDSASCKSVWTMRDGVLVCKGSPLGYLATKKSYKDFTLELQWRWPAEGKAGKGGVLIRQTGPDRIWPRSLEAQINHPDAGDFWGLAGYPIAGPTARRTALEHPQFGKLVNIKKAKNAERPVGQWNDYKIVAKGATVTLFINGQQVNKAIGCADVAGKILLTSEGDEIHFRNIRLTPKSCQ